MNSNKKKKSSKKKAKASEQKDPKVQLLDYFRMYDEEWKKKNFKSCITISTKMIALEPNRANFFLQRAKASFELRLFREVIADTNNALACQPQSAKAHMYQGCAYVENYHSALKAVNSGQPFYRHLNEALLSLDRAAELDPSLRTSNSMFARYYKMCRSSLGLFADKPRGPHPQVPPATTTSDSRFADRRHRNNNNLDGKRLSATSQSLLANRRGSSSASSSARKNAGEILSGVGVSTSESDCLLLKAELVLFLSKFQPRSLSRETASPVDLFRDVQTIEEFKGTLNRLEGMIQYHSQTEAWLYQSKSWRAGVHVARSVPQLVVALEMLKLSLRESALETSPERLVASTLHLLQAIDKAGDVGLSCPKGTSAKLRVVVLRKLTSGMELSCSTLPAYVAYTQALATTKAWRDVVANADRLEDWFNGTLLASMNDTSDSNVPGQLGRTDADLDSASNAIAQVRTLSTDAIRNLELVGVHIDRSTLQRHGGGSQDKEALASHLVNRLIQDAASQSAPPVADGNPGQATSKKARRKNKRNAKKTAASASQQLPSGGALADNPLRLAEDTLNGQDLSHLELLWDGLPAEMVDNQLLSIDADELQNLLKKQLMGDMNLYRLVEATKLNDLQRYLCRTHPDASQTMLLAGAQDERAFTPPSSMDKYGAICSSEFWNRYLESLEVVVAELNKYLGIRNPSRVAYESFVQPMRQIMRAFHDNNEIPLARHDGMVEHQLWQRVYPTQHGGVSPSFALDGAPVHHHELVVDDVFFVEIDNDGGGVAKNNNKDALPCSREHGGIYVNRYCAHFCHELQGRKVTAVGKGAFRNECGNRGQFKCLLSRGIHTTTTWNPFLFCDDPQDMMAQSGSLEDFINRYSTHQPTFQQQPLRDVYRHKIRMVEASDSATIENEVAQVDLESQPLLESGTSAPFGTTEDGTAYTARARKRPPLRGVLAQSKYLGLLCDSAWSCERESAAKDEYVDAVNKRIEMQLHNTLMQAVVQSYSDILKLNKVMNARDRMGATHPRQLLLERFVMASIAMLGHLVTDPYSPFGQRAGENALFHALVGEDHIIGERLTDALKSFQSISGKLEQVDFEIGRIQDEISRFHASQTTGFNVLGFDVPASLEGNKHPPAMNAENQSHSEDGRLNSTQAVNIRKQKLANLEHRRSLICMEVENLVSFVGGACYADLKRFAEELLVAITLPEHMSTEEKGQLNEILSKSKVPTHEVQTIQWKQEQLSSLQKDECERIRKCCDIWQSRKDKSSVLALQIGSGSEFKQLVHSACDVVASWNKMNGISGDHGAKVAMDAIRAQLDEKIQRLVDSVHDEFQSKEQVMQASWADWRNGGDRSFSELRVAANRHLHHCRQRLEDCRATEMLKALGLASGLHVKYQLVFALLAKRVDDKVGEVYLEQKREALANSLLQEEEEEEQRVAKELATSRAKRKASAAKRGGAREGVSKSGSVVAAVVGGKSSSEVVAGEASTGEAAAPIRERQGANGGAQNTVASNSASSVDVSKTTDLGEVASVSELVQTIRNVLGNDEFSDTEIRHALEQHGSVVELAIEVLVDSRSRHKHESAQVVDDGAVSRVVEAVPSDEEAWQVVSSKKASATRSINNGTKQEEAPSNTKKKNKRKKKKRIAEERAVSSSEGASKAVSSSEGASKAVSSSEEASKAVSSSEGALKAVSERTSKPKTNPALGKSTGKERASGQGSGKVAHVMDPEPTRTMEKKTALLLPQVIANEASEDKETQFGDVRSSRASTSAWGIREKRDDGEGKTKRVVKEATASGDGEWNSRDLSPEAPSQNGVSNGAKEVVDDQPARQPPTGTGPTRPQNQVAGIAETPITEADEREVQRREDSDAQGEHEPREHADDAGEHGNVGDSLDASSGVNGVNGGGHPNHTPNGVHAPGYPMGPPMPLPQGYHQHPMMQPPFPMPQPMVQPPMVHPAYFGRPPPFPTHIVQPLHPPHQQPYVIYPGAGAYHPYMVPPHHHPMHPAPHPGMPYMMPQYGYPGMMPMPRGGPQQVAPEGNGPNSNDPGPAPAAIPGEDSQADPGGAAMASRSPAPVDSEEAVQDPVGANREEESVDQVAGCAEEEGASVGGSASLGEKDLANEAPEEGTFEGKDLSRVGEPAKSDSVCMFHLKGTCRYGPSCRDKHPSARSSPQL